MEFMEPVLAGAGVVALLALAYLFWRAGKTLDVIDTTLTEANKTLAEATETLADVRSSVLPIVDKAGVTVDAVNMELLRIDAIITSFENTSKKVEKTSDSISDFVNTPTDVVADLAGRVRTAIKERRAEAQDARRSKAQAKARATSVADDDRFAPEVDDEALISAAADGRTVDDADDGFVVLEDSDVYKDYPRHYVISADEALADVDDDNGVDDEYALDDELEVLQLEE